MTRHAHRNAPRRQGRQGESKREKRRRAERARKLAHSSDPEAARELRSCASKRRYPSQDAAIAAAIAAVHARGGSLRWYRCRFCGGWHLTSKPRRKR